MQLSLQDIRLLGYRKIINFYDDGVLFNKIKNQSIEEFDKKCSPYSLSRKWKDIKCRVYEIGYYGLEMFLRMCEPMIDNEVVCTEKGVQRKVRNKWNVIWSDIFESLQEDELTSNMIKDFGIKLCYSEDIDESVVCFYNDLLFWSVFTQSNINFEVVDLTFIDVLECMIVNTEPEFMLFIKDKFLGD